VTVTEICRRPDGLPLAVELAAARIRALSPTEILNSLHDAFRLPTGGARTTVRRQQTFRASVDWSHALLSELEQVLFRRLAVFLGAFDLGAAQAVAGGERYQVLDQLTLLVDKSLVVAGESQHGTRYRLLETVRQYAMEKLAETRGGNDARTRHRAQNLRSAAHGNVTRALQNQEDRLSGPVNRAV
jgi:predicted ATPase